MIAQAVRRVFTHHDAKAVAFRAVSPHRSVSAATARMARSHNDAMPIVAHRRRQVRVTGRQCLVVVVDGGYGFDLSLSRAA